MPEYKPTILPEEPYPSIAKDCRKCELYKQRTRIIWGEGNPSAPLFVVLDNPGAREDKNNIPYLCGTRETMQTAAYEAGIQPNDIYVSFLLKCKPRRAYDKEVARESCIAYLWNQLEKANPALVMCLGNVVCQSVFENQDAEVKKLRGRVHRVKGHRVVSSYHPLAVRRRPVLYKYFLEDWQLVAREMRGPNHKPLIPFTP